MFNNLLCSIRIRPFSIRVQFWNSIHWSGFVEIWSLKCALGFKSCVHEASGEGRAPPSCRVMSCESLMDCELPLRPSFLILPLETDPTDLNKHAKHPRRIRHPFIHFLPFTFASCCSSIHFLRAHQKHEAKTRRWTQQIFILFWLFWLSLLFWKVFLRDALSYIGAGIFCWIQTFNATQWI